MWGGLSFRVLGVIGLRGLMGWNFGSNIGSSSNLIKKPWSPNPKISGSM